MMNELLLTIGSWISLLTRPLVALQIVTTGGIILASYYFIRPRITRNKPRLLFPIDIALWITLKASLYLFSSFGFPVGLSDFMTNAYFFWLILTGGRLLITSWLGIAQADIIYSRVIIPLYVVLLTGSAIELLTPLRDLAEITLFTSLGQDFTLDTVVLLLLFPYFWIVLSEFPVAWLARFLQVVLHISESGKRALQLILRYVIIGIGLIWMLNRIGLNSNGIAAIAGGLSIGVGFGVKELISNFISGLWLLFEGSVRPGDILFIDGDPCEVRKLGLRAAVLWRQRDNAELVVPNQEFFTTTTTYTGTDHLRRGEVQISAAYRHDPQQVLPLLLKAASSTELVLANPAPAVFLVAYGDSSINYIIRYWIANPMDNLTAKSLLSQAVWSIFADNGIEIPFPQRVLHTPPSIQPPR